MFIEKYTVIVGDQLSGKEKKKVKISADTVYDAHKKALDAIDLYEEDISQILNSEDGVVYDHKKGFLE